MDWTSPTWDILHLFARDCKDYNLWVFFLYSLSNILPCAECKIHFKKILKTPSNYKSAKYGIFKNSIAIHNIVRKRLNKKLFDPAQSYNYYRNMDIVRAINYFKCTYENRYIRSDNHDYIKFLNIVNYILI